MEEMQNQLTVLRFRLEGLAKDYFGPHFCDEVTDYVSTHPFIAVALVIIAVFSAIPLGIFLCFTLITAIISLIIFVFIEGTIIVIAGLVLIGVVSFISVITVGLTSAVAVAYWSAQKMHRAVCHPARYRHTTNNLSSPSRDRSIQTRRPSQIPIQDENITPDSANNISDRSSDTADNYEFIG